VKCEFERRYAVRFLVSQATERERENRMIAGISRTLSKGFPNFEMAAAHEDRGNLLRGKFHREISIPDFIYRSSLELRFLSKNPRLDRIYEKIPVIGKYPFV